LPYAIKSVKQSLKLSDLREEEASSSSSLLLELMESYRLMVNTCIRIGLETNASSLKKLSTLSYADLKKHFESVPSYYRLTAISKAAGILSSRKKIA
jgi:hypothetical protein